MFDPLFPNPQDYPLPPTPAWYQHATIGTCIFAVFLPAGPIRLSTGLLLLTLIFHATFWTYAPTYNEYSGATTSVFMFFAWVAYIACQNLERDFWRLKEDVDGRVIEEHVPCGVWAKLRWSTLFWLGPRKVGWNIQVSSIPPPVPANYPRNKFLEDKILKSIKMYLGLDIASQILRLLSHSRRHPNIFAEPLLAQVLASWATASRAYFGISLISQLAAFLSVLFNLTPPSSWPPINGPFRENFYSIRQVWGKLWHQMIRRYTSSAGRAMTNLCGFRKGSLMSKYSQLWIGFAVSALMLAPPAYMWEDRGFWQAMALLSQPVGIMVEDLAIYLGSRAGLIKNAFTKGVGYVWVFLWFSFSLRFWVATVPVQYAEGDQLPSLLRWLTRRYGVEI